MPLRQRLALHETLQDFELASEARFYEGLELMVAGHLAGGIYLLGYAAEMLLKNACYRFSGAQLMDLTAAYLAPAKLRAQQQHGITENPESYHSLRFWAALLLADRQLRGQPLPQALSAGLQQSVARLHDNWKVGMRYQVIPALAHEAEETVEDVGWLRVHYVDLWS